MSSIPYVIEDTGRGERSMDIYSRLLQDRIIFIGQELSDSLANAVIAQLLFLKTDDPKKDIHIYINSPGGYLTAGFAIYDTLRFLECDINTYCIGFAASVSALILSAGTKGKRFALPHARIMLHQPSGGVGGTSADIALQAQEILKLKQILAKMLSTSTGKRFEDILEDSERDFYLDALEAKEYGLIDSVIEASAKREVLST
ncbi:MAG: ATP-dependent Clp protease proteolytic subunit [Chlamydiae bacterium]|nr:ATP-dependent Clp protease proteolytic subunit [Chlamydiota bacterium]